MSAAVLQDHVESGQPRLLRLNVDQYHDLLEAGVLADGTPVELIDGLLVWKDRRDSEGGAMGHGPRHSTYIGRLWAALGAIVGGNGMFLNVQVPITLGDQTEPEPDASLIRGVRDDYLDHHPGANDVVCLFEVAASSLRFDRRAKQRIYAAAGVRMYVIVNIVEDCFEVHAEPQQAAACYGLVTRLTAGDMLTIPTPSGVSLSLPVSAILH